MIKISNSLLGTDSACDDYRYVINNPEVAADIADYGLEVGDIVADSAGLWDPDNGCLTMFYQAQRCNDGQCIKYANSSDNGFTFGEDYELGDGSATVTAGVKGYGGVSGPSVVVVPGAATWLLYTDSSDNVSGSYFTVWELAADE